MRVVDLTPERESLFCVCLEDWCEEMKEAGDHKANWYARMRDQGLRVKLAETDDGTVGGMMQYLPIEHGFAEGQDLYYILCIWVHGYKEGRGNFQKRGMGKALLAAAEQDAREFGAKGLVAWGVALPFFMRAAWFKKQGYKVMDKDGMAHLLWKPFVPEAVPPKWIKRRKTPGRTPGKVAVTSFINGWCPAQNIVHERARQAAAEFGEQVAFQSIDTSDRATYLEWGIYDGLYIDGKAVRTGPPPSYERIRKRIARRVRRL